MTIENKKGWISWFNPFKYGTDRWMYALHRLTGIIIGIYLLFHVFETSEILKGPVTWNSVMVSLDYPFGVHFGPLILSLVLLAVVYHALNGIRLTIVENGLMLPKPYRPEYPYNPKSLKGLNNFLKILLGIFMIVISAFGIIFIFTGWLP
jgi:succinate dehydrogenase / fumarate reductase cytochrome b subunit